MRGVACKLTMNPLLLESKSIGTRRAISGVKPILAAAQRALAPPNAAVEEAARGAYAELKDQFHDELFAALRRYQASELTGAELEKSWRGSIREAWTSAYALGNQAEGYTHGLEDADFSWLKGAWGEEYGFLGKFVQALESDTLKMSAEDRLEMYVETLDGIWNAGRVDALPENVKIHWKLHPADHCIDCLVLAGASPYDKPGTGNNPLPTTPRAGDTRCIVGCKCELVVEEIPPEAVGSRVLQTRIPGAVGEGRPPAGLRTPNEAERAFIEDMIARLTFGRQAIAELTGDAKRQEIRIQRRLADALADFLVAHKLWVPPTWASGVYLGREIDAATVDDLLAGGVTEEGVKELLTLSPSVYRILMDKYEAAVLSKVAAVKASPSLQLAASSMADLLALSLAGALAVTLGKKETDNQAARTRRPEERPSEEHETRATTDLLEGGSGSGHFGHKGRPKLRGGSLPGRFGLTIKEPIRVERHQASKLRGAEAKTLASGTVKSGAFLGGGVSGAYVVTFEDGSKAVFKKPTTQDLRPTIPVGTDHLREAAAYEVAKIVGMQDMVPATTLRAVAFSHQNEYDAKPVTVKAVGSLQAWVPQAKTAQWHNDTKIIHDGLRDWKRAAVFDFMIGNMDRHGGNWMVKEGGKLALIDHGLSFPVKNDFVWSNRRTLTDRTWLTVGAEQKVSWAKKWPAIERSLNRLGIEKEAVAAMRDRYHFLMRPTTKRTLHLDSFLMGRTR